MNADWEQDLDRRPFTAYIHTYIHTHIHTHINAGTYIHTYIHERRQEPRIGSKAIHSIQTYMHTYIHTYMNADWNQELDRRTFTAYKAKGITG